MALEKLGFEALPMPRIGATSFLNIKDVNIQTNKDGIKKLEIPTNQKQKRAVLKKKEETLLMSPAKVIYPPNSLKKL